MKLSTEQEVSEFVKTYRPVAVRAVLRYVKNPCDREEIVQDALLKAIRSIAMQRDDMGSVKSWLYAIAKNKAVEFIRHEARQSAFRTSSYDGMERADHTKAFRRVRLLTPEDVLANRGLGERLADAIRSMPLDFFEVFVMREFDGLDYREISQRIGICEGSVKSRLHRARVFLQDKLRGERAA